MLRIHMHMDQFLISKSKGVDLKYYHDSRTFIEYSNNLDGIYENVEE